MDEEPRAEILKQYEELLPKLRSPEVRAPMIADGRDPEAVVKRLTEQRDDYLARHEATEKAEEHLLQATADVADAIYDMFKVLPQVIEELKQSDPLNPQVEQLEEFYEELAEHMPKEPDP